MHKVMIADDHQIVREAMKMIIGSDDSYEIVGEASNGTELIEVAKQCQPNLIISDLKMPGESIISQCQTLKTLVPGVRIIILTAYDDSEDIYNALNEEVDGYIMKDTPPNQILQTMQMVLLGYSCFQPKVNHKQMQSQKSDSGLNLTEREEEVFRCIVDNLSNIEIADKLFISEATVKTHVSSILRKTGQPNRSQAVLYALKNGLLEITP
ncbi:response regulator [Bacillus sp. CGMCC 1.16607]|uniref:response regulator n=1 Tax=Bacillus sp. CGMCC 1.16607 TaxID=3351842 RepID=UPI00363DAD68